MDLLQKDKLLSILRLLILVTGFIIVSIIAGASQPNGEFLVSWIAVGPLDNEVPMDALLRFVGGAHATPREGVLLADSERCWTRYLGGGNIINLREIVGYAPSATAAVYCEFQSDAEQSGHLHFATPNEARLWINGQLFLESSEGKNNPLMPELRPILLREGVNTCLVLCRTFSSSLFGFTLRVDGPDITPDPPLVWNPLTPSVSQEEDGHYVLLSPDWKWRLGDDPEWAKPDYDDSGWERFSTGESPFPESGVPYWMRINAHFASNSTQVPYTIGISNVRSAALYLDGDCLFSTGIFDNTINPLFRQNRLIQLPEQGVLAVRAIMPRDAQPPHVEVRRADRQLLEQLNFLQPQRYHRLVLIFCLVSYMIYYFFAFWGHPRQREGFWLFVTLAMTILALLIKDMTCWTNRYSPGFFTWLSLLLATVAAVCAIAMLHVLACGRVHWRILSGCSLIAGAMYLYGWATNALWIAYLVYPMTTMELLRVWIVHGVIPKRENRWYIGSAIFFFIAGQLIAAGFAFFKWPLFGGFGPYAHFYGFMVFIGNTLDYMARESARGLQELHALAATLENRVAEQTQQVWELTRQLITAEENERERLARELHDSVAQTLWYARIAAGNDPRPQSEGQENKNLVELLDRAISEVRTVAYGLRPPELDKLGLVQCISQCCKEFSCNTGIILDFQSLGVDNMQLSPMVEVNLYRVLQEALNNIQLHAGATKVRVRLTRSFPLVILRVEDNGKGFDLAVQQTRSDRRMGLQNMEERMHLIGGKMRIRSTPGVGTHLVFEAPQHKVDPDVSEAGHIDCG